MQIPQELKEYEKPTMIVVTDSVQAKLFLAHHRDIEPAGHITSQYPPTDDMERTSGASPSGRHFGEQDERLQEISLEKLYGELSKELMHRLQNEEFEDLIFTVPQDHINELKESIHIQLLKRASIWVPKLLTNDEVKDILLHIEETDYPDA